ncbi:MAG: hypothetical protein AAFR60_09545 [Pseudomonadota bacterium]
MTEKSTTKQKSVKRSSHASKKCTTRKTGARRKMDQTIVSDYLAKLLATLDEPRGFQATYEQMVSDPKVQQPEAVGIASQFTSPMAISTTKKRAFERILGRHRNLMAHVGKEKITAKRTAA